MAVSDGRDFGAHHHVRINFGELRGRGSAESESISWVERSYLTGPVHSSIKFAGCPRARLEEGLEKMEAAYKAAVAAGKQQ